MTCIVYTYIHEYLYHSYVIYLIFSRTTSGTKVNEYQYSYTLLLLSFRNKCFTVESMCKSPMICD